MPIAAAVVEPDRESVWWTDIMEKIEIRASAFGQMQHVCRKFYRPKTNFELFSISILNQIYYNSIMEKSVPSSECQKLTFRQESF